VRTRAPLGAMTGAGFSCASHPPYCERSEAIHSFLLWRDGLFASARMTAGAMDCFRSLSSGAHSRACAGRWTTESVACVSPSTSLRASEAIHSFFRRDGLLRFAPQ